MLHKRLKLSCLLLFGYGLSGLQAQTSINTSGGNISGSGGSASYSVGQAVYTSITGASGSALQGVQQPYEIYVVTGVDDAQAIALEVAAYPNPTASDLIISIKGLEDPNFSYLLYDMQGKLIKNAKIKDNQTNIGMKNLVPGTYFLKVIQSNKEIKTFKIIKN